MKFFIYLCLLLFIIIFSFYLQKKNSEKCPVKIRRYFNMLLSLIIIKYSIMLIMCLVENKNIIIYVKDLALLNYIFIPLIGFISLYIFLRDDKMKFSYNQIVLTIVSISYLLLIFIYKTDISIDSELGFIVHFKEYLNPYLIYLIEIATIIVIAILNIDKKYVNKSGLRILIFASGIFIVELILFLAKINIFPYPIIGEILFLILILKNINTFNVKL